jgi:hypothetical protein
MTATSAAAGAHGDKKVQAEGEQNGAPVRSLLGEGGTMRSGEANCPKASGWSRRLAGG